MNRQLHALVEILRATQKFTPWRLDGFVQDETQPNEYVLYIELLDGKQEPTEKYVEVYRCDDFIAYDLAEALDLDVETMYGEIKERISVKVDAITLKL